MSRRTGPDRATAELVRWRDRDTCRRCPSPGQQLHHRRPRGMGGTKDPAINRPSNLVLLCASCHSWIETHRAEALSDGWLVSQWATPSAVPLIVRGRPIWLDDHGKTHPEHPKES